MHSTPMSGSQTLAAIEALRFVVDRLSPRHITLPDEAESARMLRALGATEASPAPPPTNFLEKLRRELVASSHPRQIAELSRKQLRYAPWLLWNGESPAASLHGLLAVLLDQARVSASTLRRLICAYLRDFDGDAIGIDKAAATIREELAKGGPRLETWRTAQNEVHLFDPARGPAALAAHLLEGEPQPNEILARYKLDDPLLARGKYMLAVEDAVRAAAPVMLRDYGTKALGRILKIVAPEENKLRFQSRAADTARAFLQAWLVGRGEPASALQEPVRRALLHWLNDPRLRPQRWIAVGGQETALMRRWLTRASLDLFFRLIDQNVLDAQWRYRNAFWLAYLEKGVIADAWLALGRQTFAAAGTIRELGQAYGRLRGGSANQSALLLRIGPLVVGEFTHNGSLRAWPADWPGAPRLGETDYASTRLKGSGLPFPPNPYWGRGGEATGKGLSHINGPGGYWQGSAAALIERHTGIRITRNDWQPR
jgi:hypothetical protein